MIEFLANLRNIFGFPSAKVKKLIKKDFSQRTFVFHKCSKVHLDVSICSNPFLFVHFSKDFFLIIG